MNIPRIPFVIGVTGKMALPGYQPGVTDPAQFKDSVRAVYEQVWLILDWTFDAEYSKGRELPTGLDRDTFSSGFPPQLGLRNTPVVVLSSLAPGADTIVAEATLDYAAKTKRDVSVRAPLPFPPDVYRQASTFCPEKDPGSWTAHQARYDALVERVRA